ncbi:methyltransferase type 11 [Streptomyces sp. AcH 505]|uniref:class I SAM-dependent methyltransferase n=1 Tax=Streptomyces sp. AcH 505 TaxID=352211 RepID=UPI0005919448|nr:methyltransferase type 11 [Streptomyces sp. AcH 505]
MTIFDEQERRIWAGRADAYAGSFAALCAHPVPQLLDAAGAGAGSRLLDAGTGTGTVAAAAVERGARVTAVDADPGMAARTAADVPAADVRVAALPVLPFPDGEFDATIANFVLNHVGRPRAALAELRRVTRPGGRIAVTIWPAQAAPGQTLLPRAVEAAGVVRPGDLASLAADEEFPRTAQGLADLAREAGLSEVSCTSLDWDHQVAAEVWWSGPAAGVATIGHIVTRQDPQTVAEIKRQFARLSVPFGGPDGVLRLPHTALLAHGRV